MDPLDLVRWALRQRPKGSRAVGEHGVVRVLTALSARVSAEGLSWPSVATLAADTSMPSRTVRDALDLLDAQGFIKPADAPRKGRSTRWRFPAASQDIPRGSDPVDNSDLAGNVAGNVAGNFAGDLAGNVAGYPATKGREGNGSEDARESARPAARCSRHEHDADPPNCRACMTARLAAEAYDAAEAEREADARRARAAALTDPSAHAEVIEATRKRLGGSTAAVVAAALRASPESLPVGLRLITADDVGRWS